MLPVNEQGITASEAAQVISHRLGRRIDEKTVRRWMASGYGGVRLEHLRAGRWVATSSEACERFLERLSVV